MPDDTTQEDQAAQNPWLVPNGPGKPAWARGLAKGPPAPGGLPPGLALPGPPMPAGAAALGAAALGAAVPFSGHEPRLGEEFLNPVVTGRPPLQLAPPGALNVPQADENGEMAVEALKSLPAKNKAAPAVPMPGAGGVGATALADTQAFMDALQERVRQFTPPASPKERWLRDGPPPIAIYRGGTSGGSGVMPGDLTRTTRSMSAGGPGAGGRGGVSNSWSQETTAQDTPAGYGLSYETPYGPNVGSLPNPDMMQYDREQQGRELGRAAMMEGAKGYGPAYQTQGAMADAAMRAQYEYGPMKAAQDIFNSTFAAGVQKHGDLSLAGQEAQQAKAGYLRQFGGGAPGLPGGAPAAAGADQPAGPPPDRFTDPAVLKFLGEQGLVDPTTGQAKGGLVDPLKLAESLYSNPNIAEGGRGALARALLNAGANPTKLDKEMQQRLIYLHNKAGGAPGASYGPYSVRQQLSGSAVPALPGSKPYATGYVVGTPAGEIYHPARTAFGPTEPLIGGLTESSRGDYAGQAAALAQIMAAIREEAARREGGGAAPGRQPR